MFNRIRHSSYNSKIQEIFAFDSKKWQFVLSSVILVALFFLSSINILPILEGLWYLIIPFYTIVSVIFVHRLRTIRDLVLVTLLPLFLVLGGMMALYVFPNLGIPVKFVAFLGIGSFFYALFLVNNIFLFVSSNEKNIPLYRAAVTWAQILITIVSIPLFTGIFKLPLNAVAQNTLIGICAFLLHLYSIWAQRLDTNLGHITVKYAYQVGIIVFFIIFSLTTAIAFLPAEAFMRGLFIASVLMGVMGYFQNHYGNRVSKNLLYEYFIISAIFFVLMLSFGA